MKIVNLFKICFAVVLLFCSSLGYGQTSIILSENCSKVINTGAFDLTSTDSINTYTQQPGWTGLRVYGAGVGIIKLSGSAGAGYIVTPEVNLLEGEDKVSMSVNLAKTVATCDADLKIYLDDNLIYTISKSQLTTSPQPFIIPIVGGTVASKIKIAPEGATNNARHQTNLYALQITRRPNVAMVTISDTSSLKSFSKINTTATFKVTAESLESEQGIKLLVEGENSDKFSVVPDTITPDNVGNDNSITVAFTADADGDYNAYVVARAGAAVDTVWLEGSYGDPTLIVSTDLLKFDSIVSGSGNSVVNSSTRILNVKTKNLTSVVTLSTTASDKWFKTVSTIPAKTDEDITITFKTLGTSAQYVFTNDTLFQDTLVLSCADFPDFKIPLEGVAVAPYVKVLTREVAGVTYEGAPIEISADVKSHYLTTTSYTFKLEGNDMSRFSLKSTSTAPTERSQVNQLPIVYKGDMVGIHNAYVAIESTIPGGKTLDTIFIEATTKNIPFALSENLVKFEDVVQNSSASQKVGIDGQFATENVAVNITGANFSIDKNTFTPAEVLAGDSVEITYNTATVGDDEGWLYFTCGDYKDSVQIIGNVVIPVPTILTHTTAIDFDTVLVNTTAMVKFLLKGLFLTGDMTLSLSGQDADLFSTSITTAPVIDGSFSDSVEITYMPLFKGSHMATLTVSGGGAADATVVLTAYGIDLPELQVSLDTLSFGDVKVGADSVAKFTLTAANVREDVLMTVSNPYKISSDNILFSNSVTIPRFNDDVDVYVKYSPTVVGVADTFVLISTGGQNIQVLVMGNAYTPGVIAEPSSLNFFSVYVGNSSVRSVNLTGSFLSDSVDFSVNTPFLLSGSSEDSTFSSTLRLAPFNGEQLLYVKYLPMAEGSHSENVSISSGAISTSISLQGKGTNVPPSIVTNVTLLNFGEVVLGDSAVRNITLTLTSISEKLEFKVNHPYSVSGDSINYDSILNVLPDTGDVIFYVKYKPVKEGVNISSMAINCENVPSIRIPLYATSVDEGGTTGVHDNVADGLIIYPNPFVDQLKVNSLVEINRVELVSITGRLMKVEVGPIDVINTSALPVGVYVMHVKFSNGKQLTRILLKQ